MYTKEFLRQKEKSDQGQRGQGLYNLQTANKVPLAQVVVAVL
jgi:hypothetical protein